MRSHLLAKWTFAANVVMFVALATLFATGFRSQQPAALDPQAARESSAVD